MQFVKLIYNVSLQGLIVVYIQFLIGDTITETLKGLSRY